MKNGKIYKEKCPLCKGEGKVIPSAASRVCTLRKKLKLSQEEFAKPLNISRVQIANIEGGRMVCSLSLMIRMSDHYGVSVDWLLGRTNK